MRGRGSGFRVLRDGVEVVATVAPDTTELVDEGLVNGRTYEYEVVAVTDAGESEAAGPVSVTPTADPIPDHPFTDVSGSHWADLPGWTGWPIGGSRRAIPMGPFGRG